MWTVNLINASTVVAALVGAPVMAGAQAQSAAVAKTVRPSAISLSDFCDAPPSYSEPIAIAGRRLQWARPLPPGRAASDITRVALSDPQRFVAVSTRWLAIQEDSRILTRADCETGEVQTYEQARPITALSVSQFGDIAEQTADGATIIFPREVAGYVGREGQRIERPPESKPGASVLLWSGRRLLIVGRRDIVTIDVAATQVSRTAAPVSAELTMDPDTVFAFNGITYVANGPCLDVFVGTALTPHLRRVACLRQPLSEEAVLVANLRSLEVLNSTGASVETMPRPSVAHAKIAGTTFDVTASVLSLLEHPAIPTVPLFSAGARQPGAASTETWANLLKREYWSVERGYDRMMRAVQTKGWTDLRPDALWSAGNGVAAGWRRGTSLVAPRGRSLKTLAQLTDQQAFDALQVRRIIDDNSALADTVEGSFIAAGWIPVGALFGSITTLPSAFVTPEALSSLIKGSDRPGAAVVRDALQVKEICGSLTNGTPDASLKALFRQGLPAAGAVDGGVDALVRADEVLVFDCGGRTPIQIALLNGVKATFPVEKMSRTVSRAVAAVKGLPTDAVTALTESWLDRLLRMRGRLPSLLLPTTSFELEFIVNAQTPLAEVQKPGIQLTSAESAPASARALNKPSPPDPCTVVEEATKARIRDEASMSLGSLEFKVRRLTPPLKIAVAENAVPLLSPLFSRDGLPIWVEPKDTGGFGPIQQPLAIDPTTRAARFLKHGSQVAGILVVAKDNVLRGVLADAALVWVDTMESPRNTAPLLDKLFSRKAIVNVSDGLDATWSSLSTENGSWTTGLLFVAAARNIERPEGGGAPTISPPRPPLTWTERANVMGVGLVDHGTIFPDAPYDSDTVDLVAPGAAVPTVDAAEALVCDHGTSFATAYVSAIAAMLAERAPRNWTVSQLRARLLSTADWKPEYSGKVKGGLVNADRALNNLDKNVLAIERGSQPPLEMDVIWNDSQEFELSGTEKPGAPRVPQRIQWSDILRWQVTDGPTGKSIRVAFIHGGRYTVLDNVTVTGRPVLPLVSCLNRATGTRVSCNGVRAEQIREYTGALYAQPLPVKF